VKSEFAIKPGRQDGKLMIFERKCAYGDCEHCGIGKFFTAYKCPLEWDDTMELKIKEYQDMERNNSDRKQKELVLVTVTAMEVMEKISKTAVAVMKHLWESWWGSHQRRFDYNTFTKGMVRYKADFSATLDINPQDKLNSAICAHAIQNVMIFSLKPEMKMVTNKEGLTHSKRFIRNIGFNFWGAGNYTLSNNYYFHFKCLEWAVKHLRSRFGNEEVKYLVGYTDGCPDQYKSRLNALVVGEFCDKNDLEEYIHVFAPTARFKTNVDAFGSDTKTYIAVGERRETFRCPTAEDVYRQCKEMPQPRISTDLNRELETCDERIQVYLVDIKDANESHRQDPNVIITDSIEESWDASELKGIKSVYSLRGYKGSCQGEKIDKIEIVCVISLIQSSFFLADNKCVVQMRNHPCFCSQCRDRNYAECRYVDIVGSWVSTTMTRKVIPKVYDEVPADLVAVTKFFHGAILQRDPIILLGIILRQKGDGTKILKIATFAAPPRINKKEPLIIEHKIDGVNYVVTILRKTAFVRAKLLVRHPTNADEFLLPINAKHIDFPVTDIIDPTSLVLTNPLINRLTYVDYQTAQSSYMNNQSKVCLQTTYKISENSLQWLTSQV
jgi:hypothetical protein